MPIGVIYFPCKKDIPHKAKGTIAEQYLNVNTPLFSLALIK